MQTMFSNPTERTHTERVDHTSAGDGDGDIAISTLIEDAAALRQQAEHLEALVKELSLDGDDRSHEEAVKLHQQAGASLELACEISQIIAQMADPHKRLPRAKLAVLHSATIGVLTADGYASETAVAVHHTSVAHQQELLAHHEPENPAKKAVNPIKSKSVVTAHSDHHPPVHAAMLPPLLDQVVQKHHHPIHTAVVAVKETCHHAVQWVHQAMDRARHSAFVVGAAHMGGKLIHFALHPVESTRHLVQTLKQGAGSMFHRACGMVHTVCHALLSSIPGFGGDAGGEVPIRADTQTSKHAFSSAVIEAVSNLSLPILAGVSVAHEIEGFIPSSLAFLSHGLHGLLPFES